VGQIDRDTAKSIKGSWVELGDKRFYGRSRWERNFARYLNFLLERGEIKNWFHEPHTFWFEKIKRGVRSYLPDFKVEHNNGSTEWFEVKGYMDDKSRTKLKRMGIYYPEEKIRVVDGQWFKENNKKMRLLIKEWE
jgi:hypothetical protein